MFYRILKIVFIVNLSVALGWLISFAAIKISGIEFISPKHEDIYFGVGIIPMAILPLTFLLSKIVPIDTWYNITGKLLAGILFSALFLFIAGAASLSNMCSWTTKRVIYTNLQNPEIQIVERDYGCGATDSSPAVKRTFRIKKVLSVFMKVSPYEISAMKSSEWKLPSK